MVQSLLSASMSDMNVCDEETPRLQKRRRGFAVAFLRRRVSRSVDSFQLVSQHMALPH
jgi:hypothetical protein